MLSSLAGGELTIEAKIGDRVFVFQGVCTNLDVRHDYNDYFTHETTLTVRLVGPIEQLAEYEL